MEGFQEKELFGKGFPFRMFINQEHHFEYPAHWHNAIEIIYAQKNSFSLFVNSKKYELEEKDICFIPCGDIHEFRGESPCGTRIFINFELFGLGFYGDMNQIRTQLRDVRQITPKDGIWYEQIEDQIQKILKEPKTGDRLEEFYYTARVFDILLLLCKSIPSRIHMENLENSGGKNAGLNKISKSLEYLESNYAEEIHLKDIAQAAGFSEYYFSRLFKEVTEKSFHQYLTEYRLKKAEILLADPSQTVAEAAYTAGFSSIATFNRIFRAIKGCSPQEFRKLFIGQHE